jgi:hypothetical protein
MGVVGSGSREGAGSGSQGRAASSRSRPSPGVFEQTRCIRPAANILVKYR